MPPFLLSPQLFVGSPRGLFVKKHTFLSRCYELLSSMRFAVTLFVALIVASIIGTVLKQNEPYPSYLIEFGAFWFDAWRVLGLYDVYHAVWFLAICGFLVLSTSVCILRHAPGFIREMRSYRLRAQRLSLAHIPQHHVWSSSLAPEVLLSRIQAVLNGLGYRFKIKSQDDFVLVAAKSGGWQRSGYFLVHIAIVLICIGGLIDGNLPYQVQNWLGIKKEELRDIPQSQVPAISRLSPSSLSFRGNVNLSEGQAADVIFLNSGQGYLVQELPFYVELKQFYVEHYSTGQPKRFASDIVVTNKKTGEKTTQTIEVNKPLTVDGVTIYQASFGDGGSPIELEIWGRGSAQSIKTTSRKTENIRLDEGQFALELGDFRLFNIEPLDSPDRADALQRAMTVRQPKQAQNIGPSISYKLRNSSGQAQEFQSYMAPVAIEGRSYWATGVRDEVGAPFRFLRIPLDERQTPLRFMRVREILGQKSGQEQMAAVLAEQMLGLQPDPSLRSAFHQSALRILTSFNEGGFPALERLVDDRVPAEQRPLMLETNLKILMAFAWQAELMLAQSNKEPAPLWNGEKSLFLMDVLQSMSDWKVMKIPALVELKTFTNVKSSGLQLTRSPGKNLVWLGSLMLIVGTFIMFYVRERRLWIHLQANELLLAMTISRKDAAFEREFEHLKNHMPLWLEEPLDG